MSAYHPPTEDLAIFDPSVFNFNETPLTIGEASNYFLRYPQAQGEEDLQAINVLGTATFEDTITLNKNPTANITAPNNISMTSTTGNIDFITTIAGTGIGFNTGIVDLVCDRLVNTGSYNQGVQNNSGSNPKTINFDVGCMICSTAGNDIQTLPYTQYSNGFIFSAVNLTAGVINLVSQDIDIYSWLRGNVATIYPIQPNSSITCELLPDFLTLGASIWFVRDDFGYKTINTTANATHYLNFSDASTSGVGNIQKCAGLSVNPNTNTITATSFSGSATGVLTTSDNSNGNYFIPFSKTTAGANTALYLDDTTGTGPLYNPTSGALTITTGQCNRYDSSGPTASSTLFGNVGTGNVTIANAITTGSISIGTTAMTSGNITIGTAGATGVVNIRPVLTLSNVLRTNNTISPSNDLDLGKTFTYFGSNFVNTNLAANIVLNVLSESFAAARFGTYLITANVIIKPINTTAVRNCQISISTALGTIQSPYFVRTYSAIGGNVDTLFITRVVPIYTATTITLTALCDTNAIIDAGVTDNLLTFTRIA